ncbi:hypothetical protein Ddye_008727 [Dipteronia dyeriana]|uniref:hAT-like transposase RNase-H fold domain-containing protein n=1 Tax=Dipteronia dyeriana TaxID=168575 RepID=A0AAE0CLK9_9ROSI|nr:hypothetical protein Ddye_008727 [Dipteronia dyeriana]
MNKHIEKRCKKYQPVDPTQKVLVKQPTMSGFGSTLGVSKFDQLRCRRVLAEMLILDELPFKFVENRGFQRFCFELCPLFDLPSRRTIVRDLYQLYIDEKIKLKDYFNRSKVRVCLTTDTWTSIQNINYMVVTAHFIDYDWQLQKRILSFSQIVDHKGDSIGKCIKNVLLEWGIDKVFTITVDNATANTIAIVSDGLKDLHDSIVAIRNAVKYVKSSPIRLDRFKKAVAHEKIGTKGLVVLDVPTRWNSTYLMLESAMKLRKAFERMGEEDLHYVNYFRDDDQSEQKRIGPPNCDDWDNAKVFINFLATSYDITLDFSASLRVTSNIYFKSLCTIRNQLISLSTEIDPLVSKIAVSMKQKFDKYWKGLEQTNNLLILAVVLDPRYKLGYVKFRFDSIYGVEESQSMIFKLKGVLLDLYDWYDRFYSTLGGGVKETDDMFSLGVGSGPSDDIELERLKATNKEDSLWGMKQQEEDVNKGKSETVGGVIKWNAFFLVDCGMWCGN